MLSVVIPALNEEALWEDLKNVPAEIDETAGSSSTAVEHFKLKEIPITERMLVKLMLDEIHLVDQLRTLIDPTDFIEEKLRNKYYDTKYFHYSAGNPQEARDGFIKLCRWRKKRADEAFIEFFLQKEIDFIASQKKEEGGWYLAGSSFPQSKVLLRKDLHLFELYAKSNLFYIQTPMISLLQERERRPQLS